MLVSITLSLYKKKMQSLDRGFSVMINELKIISDSLDAIGEGAENIHRDIFVPGGTEALHVFLGAQGTIESIEYMDAVRLGNTWGLKTSNQDLFPSIKLTRPLVSRGNEFYSSYYAYINYKKNDPTKKEKFLEQCEIEGVNDHYFLNKNENERYLFLISRFKENIENEFSEWPKKSYRESIINRLDILKNSNYSEVKIVAELYRRYAEFEKSGVDFLLELKGKVCDAINNYTIPQKLLLNILFGQTKADKKGHISDRSILFLDYKPSRDIDEFVFTEKRKLSISDFLNSLSSNTSSDGISALTGDRVSLVKDKFPEKNLGKGKSVSKIGIFSKFDDKGNQLTVQRYRKAGTASYSLGIDESNQLAETIFKVTSDEYKNKMWASIPSEGRSQDLLVSFCTPMIAGEYIEDIDDYLDVAEGVINAYSGGDTEIDTSVHFAVWRKINDGNQKVIYSATSSLKKLQHSANEWAMACKNVPDFKLLAKIRRKNKALSPLPIAPIEIIHLTKNKYIRNGLSSIPVVSLSFADTMFLFMSQSSGVKQLALRAISKLANQVEPLFEYCALSKNQWQMEKKNRRVETKTDKNSVALKTATLLGILLFKAGRRKEDFMSSFAYQLGQLCSAMDELHIGYCQSVRGGDIPNALIGNTAYQVALQSPLKSLALLATRIKPYEAWAKKTRAKNRADNIKIENKVILAGLGASVWLEKQCSIIAEHFSASSPLVNETYKAEVMLGYLAGRPFNEKNVNSDKEGVEQ
ncbi:conserved hypothetical protein [delta proteobacterium NaphS2]|nr:conserved hypothetical protein [delta proteobacterium NaphS2]